jgi:hypothetical protein
MRFSGWTDGLFAEHGVDPLAIARVFGLRSVAELEQAYPLRLPDVLREHHNVLEPER